MYTEGGVVRVVWKYNETPASFGTIFILRVIPGGVCLLGLRVRIPLVLYVVK